MALISVRSEAFSHSQIRSKLWLIGILQKKFKSNLNQNQSYHFHWLGCWIGTGPLLLFSALPKESVGSITLYDLDAENLTTSVYLLDYWRCENIPISTHQGDINKFNFSTNAETNVFINTACEHISDNTWLENIPKNSFIVLQSTNMPDIDHKNSPNDLSDFLNKYSHLVEIEEKAEIQFNYPDKDFSRFMLLGRRK